MAFLALSQALSTAVHLSILGTILCSGIWLYGLGYFGDHSRHMLLWFSISLVVLHDIPYSAGVRSGSSLESDVFVFLHLRSASPGFAPALICASTLSTLRRVYFRDIASIMVAVHTTTVFIQHQDFLNQRHHHHHFTLEKLSPFGHHFRASSLEPPASAKTTCMKYDLVLRNLTLGLRSLGGMTG